MEKKGYVYIMFNKPHGTLYVGVTTDLSRRVRQHKDKFDAESFTARYAVDKLGYYEEYQSIVDAIVREKQLKSGSRRKKVGLIVGMNPAWEDLFDYWDGG